MVSEEVVNAYFMCLCRLPTNTIVSEDMIHHSPLRKEDDVSISQHTSEQTHYRLDFQ